MSEKDETNSGPEYPAGSEQPAGEDAATPDAGNEPDSTTEAGPEGEADGRDDSGAAPEKGDAAANVPPTPEEETEEQYEVRPGGGHRVTRRTVHRTRLIEDVEETVTEYLPPSAYVAPAASGHPAPVG